MIDYQASRASNKMDFARAFKTRVRVSRVSKNNWLTSVLWNHRPAEYYGKLPTTSEVVEVVEHSAYVHVPE